jgi:hypothetical protein
MPSDKTTDERASRALEVLAKAREDYHSALVATSEELRGLLDAGSASEESRAERTAAELGSFAVGRIDIERFSSFEETGEPVAVTEAPRLEAASRTLRSLLERGTDLYYIRVEPGSDLRDAISNGLGRAGRTFGAARTVELSRSGSYDEATHGGWMDSFPPALWSRREKQLAPPLVVEVDGTDLRPGGLTDFLDGEQKIVLVVRGAAPPAALSRLITPGVVVVQTDDPADLSVVAEAEGPAIAALVPADACRFVHLPAVDGGRGRLTVQHMPTERPKRPLGGISAFQQVEGLRHLEALAAGWGLSAPETAVPSGDGASAPAPAASAADTLAAWILRQADISGTG